MSSITEEMLNERQDIGGMGDEVKQRHLASLEGREDRKIIPTRKSERVSLSKYDILDITGWKNERYQKYTTAKKKKILEKKGFEVYSIKGRGDKAVFDIGITSFTYQYLLLREELKKSDVNEAYLKKMFTGETYEESGAGYTIPNLKELSELYAKDFGGSPRSIENNLSTVRNTLKQYKYLATFRLGNQTKMYKVKKKNEDGWVSGAEAMELSEYIREEYKKFYAVFHKKNYTVFYMNDDRINSSVMDSRKQEALEFTERLCKRKGWDIIRPYYSSAANSNAYYDYSTITQMFRMGATFTEIRAYLSEIDELRNTRRV